MKTAVWFVLKFLAISLPLTWFWVNGGKTVYAQWFREWSAPFYTLFGLESFPAPARQRYVHMIPFVALMFATPGITLARRIGFTGLGLFLTFFIQILVNWIAISQGRGALPPPAAAVSDALPFTLWAFNARGLLPGPRPVPAPEEDTDATTPECDEATDP